MRNFDHLILIGFMISISFFDTSCSRKKFTEYNILGDLRVLTIIVDQPEVNPGTPVSLTPVLSDLQGAGRTLNYSVQTCIDPGLGNGVKVTSCASPDTTQSGTTTIPAGSGNTYTDAVSPFSVTVPDAATIFASASAVQQYNGIAYLVFYTLSVPGGGASVSSYVRVMVTATTKVTKNANPTITSVNLADSPIASPITMPIVAENLSVMSPVGATETYQVMRPPGSLSTMTENLVSTWFISDGTTQFQRTLGISENLWTPPDIKPTTRGLVIMVVTRDGRGGAVYQKIEMN